MSRTPRAPFIDRASGERNGSPRLSCTVCSCAFSATRQGSSRMAVERFAHSLLASRENILGRNPRRGVRSLLDHYRATLFALNLTLDLLRRNPPMHSPQISRRGFLSLTAAGGFACALPAGRLRAADDAPNVREIGSRVEMFVDRYLLDSLDGAGLRLHSPEKREVVLELDQPWEGASSAYYTLLRDGDMYRVYYRGSGTFQRGRRSPVVFCMAESTDAVHFVRPNVGIYEFNGSRENNIILRDERIQDNFTPMIDRNPAAKPEERYKAIAATGGGALHALASPDGLHWRYMQETPITTDGAFDSLNLAYWDERLGKYRMFSRYLDVQNRKTNAERNRAVWEEGAKEPWVRAIQSSTSEDFLHWEPAQPHQYADDAPVEHLYTNATVPCPGAEHILLSFPKRFFPSRRVVPKEEHEPAGLSDAVFMSSRDGVHWDREFPEAWVRPGRDQRNWTQRGNMVAWGVLETAPDEFSLYISEHYEWPTNRLRRMTVRRHGFASIYAGAAGGWAQSHPVRFEGSKLMLNFATSAGGSLRVELQDEAGQPIPGYTIDDCETMYGDFVYRPVTWGAKSSVAELAGKPIRLRVYLQDADLYSLQFQA